MKCPHCGTENQEQANFCSECGRQFVSPNSVEAAATRDATASSASKEQKKSPILNFLIKAAIFVFALFLLERAAFFVMCITKAPRELWWDYVWDSTQDSVITELVDTGFPPEVEAHSTTANRNNYWGIDFDYQVCSFKNFEDKTGLSSILLMGFDSEKKIYVYNIFDTWNIVMDGSELGAVKTSTTVIAQPTWKDGYAYKEYVYTEVPDTLRSLGAEYKFSAMQSTLENKFQFQHFYLNHIDSWYSGEYEQLVAEYQWTNTDNHAKSPFTDVSISAYQNGVELKTDYTYDQPYDALTSIEPGKTITNSVAFTLNDPYTDVEIHVKNYLAEFSGDLAEISRTVPLNSESNATPVPGTFENQFSSNTRPYAEYNLDFYEGSYSNDNDSVNVTLIVQPSGTEFYCELFWLYGRFTEDGIVIPGIPAQLSEGTSITIDLLSDGNIQVTLEQDGPDGFNYSLLMQPYYE